MDKLKGHFFVFACWLAAKAIRMRAKQMLNEGCFVNTDLPIAEYCAEVFTVDFAEVMYEFINE